MSYPEPDDDYLRIIDLLSYDVLYTPLEDTYSNIARRAAEICQCPIALIGFITQDRHWIKASFGISIESIDREDSLCAHTIMSSEPLICSDMKFDDRFCNNPFVKVEHGLRFYAGIPLVTHEGYSIGAICVVDTSPGILTNQQIHGLRQLADEILYLLNLRKLTKEKLPFT